jgi:hypothetical protein
LKDDLRRRAARKIAQGYAPRPESSLAMYVVIGNVLSILTLVLFGQFYDIDIISHPAWYAPFIIFSTLLAVFLWVIRRRRHNKAHRTEYDRTDPAFDDDAE